MRQDIIRAKEIIYSLNDATKNFLTLELGEWANCKSFSNIVTMTMIKDLKLASQTLAVLPVPGAILHLH